MSPFATGRIDDSGVGRLTLARPAKRNALNHELVDAALAVLDGFATAGVGVVVLEAEGGVFCAGNDIAEARADRHRAASDRMLQALLERPFFFVAVVAGPALGAGVSLAAVCPVSIATPAARFALPERDIGLYPAGVLPYIEPLIGARRAFEAGLTGAPIDPTEARDLGLISEVCDDVDVEARLDHWTSLLQERPAVTDAGRKSWQQRFRTPAATARAGQLRTILDAQTFSATPEERTSR